MVYASDIAFPETYEKSRKVQNIKSAKSDDFKLEDSFVSQYIGRQPHWGPLGYVTYKRTYARPLDSIPDRYLKLAEICGLHTSEEWWLTVLRVVEGTYKIQRKHCLQLRLPWSDSKAQKSAQEMYKLIWDFKFMPPGRGLWMMGTDYVEKAGGAALNNCAFTSTADIITSFSAPFCFLMDMSMLGVGVGGDTKGAGKVRIMKPKHGGAHHVDDSREGWVDLLRRVLDAYVGIGTYPSSIDYSAVRLEGSPIRGFGGISAGPEPLKELIATTKKLLDSRVGRSITSENIVDLFNMIGRCVVSGNVRRTAEIMFGEPDDEAFLDLKNPEKANGALAAHRWASNNSVFVPVGQDYSALAELTARNGEPGYMWLDNARNYGRMIDPPDFKDMGVMGGNPCLEQSLESFELCCLVETFPSRHKNYEEFERTLKFAYLYAKTVTLVPTHDSRTNAVLLRNRRIGTSMSGIVQAFQRHGRRNFLNWCDKGYKYLRNLDNMYSRWMCIPASIKITSVKPSGTVSLLPGVTPGIHYPHSEYYHRVIRFATNSAMLPALRSAGYNCVEIDPAKEPNTTAVYFAVKEEHFDRSKTDVTMWEQLENAAQIQAYWADNQVSATITFQGNEAKQISNALEMYETRLKGISFLPLQDHGYEHAPYQTIDKETYESYIGNLKPLDLNAATNEALDKFCDGDTCLIVKK